MGENKSDTNEEIKREIAAMRARHDESFAKLQAMDRTDKEAVVEACDAFAEQCDQDKRRMEQIAYEIMDRTNEWIEQKSAENPAFAAWAEEIAAETERLTREKNEQEGWHEVVE